MRRRRLSEDDLVLGLDLASGDGLSRMSGRRLSECMRMNAQGLGWPRALLFWKALSTGGGLNGTVDLPFL